MDSRMAQTKTAQLRCLVATIFVAMCSLVAHSRG
jgi:hypothetical protein